MIFGNFGKEKRQNLSFAVFIVTCRKTKRKSCKVKMSDKGQRRAQKDMDSIKHGYITSQEDTRLSRMANLIRKKAVNCLPLSVVDQKINMRHH